MALFPAGEDQPGKKAPAISYQVGLNVSLNNTKVKMGDEDMENTLSFYYAALEVDLDLFDNITLGVLAGFNSNSFDDPVDFTQLPISLRFDKKKNTAMNFGLCAKSEFSISKMFSIQARGQYLIFKLFEKEFSIDLPIVTGTATTKNSFSQLTVAVMGQYDGLTNMTVFAGPQLNLIDGKYEVREHIEQIDVEESIKFKQKSLVGFTGGVRFDIGDNLALDIRAGIISNTFISASLFYIF
jgi:hypothetical protein